jgi:hypothetical protein
MDSDDEVEEQMAKAWLFDLGIVETPDLVEQCKIFFACLRLRQERGTRYGDTWKRRGYKGSFSMIDHKYLRLDQQFWRNTPDLPIEVDDLDDAYDMINYTVFMIQNALAGRVWDATPEVPNA